LPERGGREAACVGCGWADAGRGSGRRLDESSSGGGPSALPESMRARARDRGVVVRVVRPA